MSESWAWIRSNRSWMARPKYRVPRVTPGSGSSAQSVSRTSIHSMIADRDDKTEHGAEEIHDGRAHHHADRAEVVCGTRHEITRPVGVEIRLRQAFQVGEKIVPQVIFDLPGRADKLPAH